MKPVKFSKPVSLPFVLLKQVAETIGTRRVVASAVYIEMFLVQPLIITEVQEERSTVITKVVTSGGARYFTLTT